MYYRAPISYTGPRYILKSKVRSSPSLTSRPFVREWGVTKHWESLRPLQAPSISLIYLCFTHTGSRTSRIYSKYNVNKTKNLWNDGAYFISSNLPLALSCRKPQKFRGAQDENDNKILKGSPASL